MKRWKYLERVKDCRDTRLTLNIMIQQNKSWGKFEGWGRVQHLLKIIHLKYEMMTVMEQYFRSESDSCSTIFSCGPMHELCTRKHSISYCYPIVLLMIIIYWFDEYFIPILFSGLMCWFYYRFVSLSISRVQLFYTTAFYYYFLLLCLLFPGWNGLVQEGVKLHIISSENCGA